jgi:hypothetical protein
MNRIKLINGFRILQQGLKVSIIPGTCMFVSNGIELRNGSTEYICKSQGESDYTFNYLANYAENCDEQLNTEAINQ